MADRTLYQRYFTYAFVVPAGTDPFTPEVLNVTVFETVLRSVDVLIPNGHAGLTGLAFDYAGERIVPWGDNNTWLQGNDQELHVAVGLQVSGSVFASGYNLGGYDHTFYLRVLLDYVAERDNRAGTPLTLVV